MFEDEIPVGRATDLRGKKFGKLTVLYRVKNVSGNARWKCLCECGNTTEVNGNLLTGNRTKSCGCLGGKFKDITGEKFGKLLVLGIDYSKPCTHESRVYWLCRCDCGQQTSVESYPLRHGHTLSCGCLQKERTSNASFKDRTNQRYGKLVALYPINLNRGENIKWHCLCDCGRECDVLGASLENGGTQSCGCLRSVGEMRITDLLTLFKINFIKQYTYETCRFPDTMALAKFDFYLSDYNILIEYDGTIHYKEHIKDNGWNTFERFKKRQEHDAYKNQWCRENNIPLIRIPYTKLDTLCIEDLMLETTQFRIV